ncbi:LysE family translocator [Leucobacter celer]|jgi:threonine/homoserine/homoserine lactone efflux protein|uniref:LysE family translocator n=1 Tax=Leucobacter celer TaxID=668625 RepID=UPI0006A7C3F1|nr:LysE family translocator [Leucobacter celer]
MVPMENLIAFGIAAFILIVVPGPSVLFMIGRSLALGRAGGMLSVLGNTIGSALLVVAVALGVGAIVAASAVLFTALKLGGAAYLVYLGVQAIRHRHDAASTEVPQIRLSWRRQVMQGLVVGVTNPKSIAFFVAVLPQFVSRESGAIPMQMLTLGLICVAIGTICDSAWVFAASAARGWFGRSPKRLAALGAVGGGFLITLGGVLAFSGSRQTAV